MMTALNFLLIGVVVKLLDGVTNRMPVGYQDESGFHFGTRKS